MGKKMKIIITGASGFVGTNLTELFQAKGHEVLPLSLRKDNWHLPASASAVIHLAGIEKDTNSVSNEDEYFKVNAQLTENIFKEFLNSGISDFVFVSSIKAVADSSKEILTETIEPRPLSPYGKSKLLAEQLISKYKIPAGKRLIILRPCLIHGPNDQGNLKSLNKIAMKGIPYPFGDFENKRSYLSIDNFSFLLLKILENANFSSGIYNVADDTSLSTKKLIEIMYQTLEKKPKILNLPASPIKMIAKLFTLVGFSIVEEKLKKLTDSYVVSNLKIKEELDIKDLPFSAEEGLIKTLISFQK